METGVSVEKALSILKGESVETSRTSDERNLAYLKIDEALIDLKYPRKSAEPPESLKGFAENIKAFGVLEPILVQKDENGKVYLLDGKRRLQVAKMAGLEKVPLIYLNPDMKIPIFMFHFIMNNFKKTLYALDEGEAYQELMGKELVPKRVLGIITGKSEKELDEILAVNELPEWVKEKIRLYSQNAIEIPASVIIRLAKLKGEELEEEALRYFNKIRPSKKDVIKRKAENLDKTLTYQKEEDILDGNVEKIKKNLKPLKTTIDQFGVEKSLPCTLIHKAGVQQSLSPVPVPNQPSKMPPYYYRMHPQKLRKFKILLDPFGAAEN